MKKKILKNSIIMALLASFCVAPFASCAPSNTGMSVGAGLSATTGDANQVKVPKYYEVPNDFRLVAYGTPTNTLVTESFEAGIWAKPDPYIYNTQENWQILKDCGFTYAQPSFYEAPDGYRSNEIVSFENADAVNAANPDQEPLKVLLGSYDYTNYNSLGAIIKDGGTYAEAMARIEDRADGIKARYDSFAAYDSFAGIFATDEPSAHMFEAIAAAQDWFEWNYPEYEFYVNLFPEYATDQQFFGQKWAKGNEYDFGNTGPYYGGGAGQTYDGVTLRQWAFNKYLSEFCEEVTPYIVSYDHYCLIDSYTVPGFFYNLASAANNAKTLEDKMDVEIPFYIYLQSEGFEGKMKIENYERWAWQCYTSMAFGVTGIQAFCYWTMLAEQDDKGNAIEEAIVTRTGAKTPLYDIVKRTNADIKALEDVYMSYNWEGTRGFWNNEGGKSELMTQLRTSGLETAGYTDISNVEITNDPSHVREFLIGQFANRATDSKKAYMITNSSKVNAAFDLVYPAGQINVTFANNITHVDVYKPGSNGIAERVALNGGVLSLTIPTGEGFFVVPVTE